jgi:hypothetical protein
VPQKSLKFAEPAERSRLEPFASTLLEVVVPASHRGNWLETGTEASAEDLAKITRRIEARIRKRMGGTVHPAIWVHALLVCVHYYCQAASTAENIAETNDLTADLDGAFSLLQRMKNYHGLYEMYLRVS